MNGSDCGTMMVAAFGVACLAATAILLLVDGVLRVLRDPRLCFPHRHRPLHLPPRRQRLASGSYHARA